MICTYTQLVRQEIVIPHFDVRDGEHLVLLGSAGYEEGRGYKDQQRRGNSWWVIDRGKTNWRCANTSIFDPIKSSHKDRKARVTRLVKVVQ